MVEGGGKGKKVRVEAKEDVEVVGRSLCGVIATEGSITAMGGVTTECLMIAVGDIVVGSELVNRGSVIAGRKIMVNGEVLEKKGFHDGGYYWSDLQVMLLDVLESGQFSQFYELIPRSYIGLGGKMIFTISEVVSERLYKGFINSRNYEEMSFLMYMASDGNMEAVKWLLGEGANPYFKDVNGWGAVEHARECGHEGVVDYLLKWMEGHPEVGYGGGGAWMG